MMAFGEQIPIKTRREIEIMRIANRHVAEILLELRELVNPGITTGDLDRHAAKAIKERGVVSSFKGYDPHGLPKYPAVVCASVNEEIVHGIPGERELKSGDIIGIDFGISIDGYHGDSAVTLAVDEVGAEEQRLLDTTAEALCLAIEEMQPGRRLSDIGHAVQERVESEGYSVVRVFAGHGIGRKLHEPPWIPNYGAPGRGPRLMNGMVFAIEPMVNIGSPDVRMLDDEWTAVTADGSLSAHFEHTILITEDGPDVLTRIEGSH
jgi:methionyl aminopeptidase